VRQCVARKQLEHEVRALKVMRVLKASAKGSAQIATHPERRGTEDAQGYVPKIVDSRQPLSRQDVQGITVKTGRSNAAPGWTYLEAR